MISGPSSQGRRQVLVYRLEGGSPLTGVIQRLSGSGLSMVVTPALKVGEAVRMIFPTDGPRPRASGRTIIGHVAAASGGVVGVDFAWEVGFELRTRVDRTRARRSWWRRLLDGNAAPARSPKPSLQARSAAKQHPGSPPR